jgi:hypothetical protein
MAGSWDLDGSHVWQRRESGERSGNHCLRGDPPAAMTRSRSVRQHHRIPHHSSCAAFSAGSNLVPTALRNDQLFQHNQKKTQEGND